MPLVHALSRLSVPGLPLILPGRNVGIGWSGGGVEDLADAVHVLREFTGCPGLPRAGRAAFRQVSGASSTPQNGSHTPNTFLEFVFDGQVQ